MATTALQAMPEPIPVERYPRHVEELTNLITSNSRRFRRIALSHLRNLDDAEDALQDAILSALTHVDQFRGQAKMSTWLTSIVINSARMKLRKRGRGHVPLDETNEQDFTLEEMLSDTRPTPEEAYCHQEINKALAYAISRLSPTLLTTFQLRDVHGLSIREAANILGVPPGTVKARLARGRARLRELMKKSTCKRLDQQ